MLLINLNLTYKIVVLTERIKVNMTSNKDIPIWQGFLKGSIGAVAGGIASHPFDLIKVCFNSTCC